MRPEQPIAVSSAILVRAITQTMPTPEAPSDADIRSALHSTRLSRANRQAGTLVIDELGLAHAQSRVDVAVLNGCLHGYEIKSERDNLLRLERQLATYRQTLEKLTIVSASSHVAAISSFVPEWAGIIEAQQGPRGGIRFVSIRHARRNPEIDPVMVAHLLWRAEAIDLLLQIGFTPRDVRRPRKQLYELVGRSLSLREIIDSIRDCMFKRRSWRAHSSQA